MKTSTISEIKKALHELDKFEVVELCLRLAKYKKENKELLNYLVFDASNEQAFIEEVKQEINDLYTELPRANAYVTKKGLRKILKITHKYNKYANSKTVELDLLLHVCHKMKSERYSPTVLSFVNVTLEKQMLKMRKAMQGLHEDLQYDYNQELEKLFLNNLT